MSCVCVLVCWARSCLGRKEWQWKVKEWQWKVKERQCLAPAKLEHGGHAARVEVAFLPGGRGWLERPCPPPPPPTAQHTPPARPVGGGTVHLCSNGCGRATGAEHRDRRGGRGAPGSATFESKRRKVIMRRSRTFWWCSVDRKVGERSGEMFPNVRPRIPADDNRGDSGHFC